MNDRIDVVVLGASALTAREVCRYLGHRAPALGRTWAAAGRDAGRVRSALSDAGVAADDELVADVTDPASLARLARSARVLVNLVGPYARSAADVVEACIEHRTHYLDLTGETLFLRRLIDTFDEQARAAGVKVVQPCGFESLPVDLLFGLAVDELDDVASLDVQFTVDRVPRNLRPGDAVSGGTVRSLLEMLDDDAAARTFDPALLVRDDRRAAEVRRVSPLRIRPRLTVGGDALAPLLPAPTINPPVIQRSAELLGLGPLRYREGSRLPGGVWTLPATLPVAALAGGVYAGARSLTRAPAPVRRRATSLLGRVLPDSGDGPAADRVQDWRWRLDAEARAADGRSASVGVTGLGHPGYLSTAHMLAEAALALRDDASLPERSGLLTPLAALGTTDIARFSEAGLTFRGRDAGTHRS